MGNENRGERPPSRVIRRPAREVPFEEEPQTTPEPPEIVELRQTPKWDVLEKAWELEERHIELTFPIEHEDFDKIPKKITIFRREMRKLQFDWRALVFQAAGITKEEWVAYRKFKLGPIEEDEEEAGNDDW